jgi:hypothetical protein
MPSDRRVIAQGLILSSFSSPYEVYRVPTSPSSRFGKTIRSVVSSITVCNLSATISLLTSLNVVKSGETESSKAQIIANRPFAGKETIIFPFSLTLESGDYISIKSGTSGQFGSGVLIIMVSAQESL